MNTASLVYKTEPPTSAPNYHWRWAWTDRIILLFDCLLYELCHNRLVGMAHPLATEVDHRGATNQTRTTDIPAKSMVDTKGKQRLAVQWPQRKVKQQ